MYRNIKLKALVFKLNSLREFLKKSPKPFVFIFSVFVVSAIALFQRYLNYQVDLHLLYFFPLLLVCWIRSLSYSIPLLILILIVWSYPEFYQLQNEATYFVINTILKLLSLSFLIVILELLKDQMKNLLKETRHDTLTGLYNIRFFMELAEEERQRLKRLREPYSLAYIDVDNFKGVNDKLGHLEGNRLLKGIASTLISHTRSIDRVARFGGDEFVILFSNTNQEQAEKAGILLYKQLQVYINENQWPIGFSIGIIVVERLPNNTNEVIHAADNLMYQVKKAGKNNIKLQVF